MRALISVSDKTGVVDFAKGLRALGWEVIATGGTMKLLSDSGVEVINISDVTGFPEICDGRVKTLHPNVHGGLLARRDDPEHLKALKDNNIEFIDMVCVNLYPVPPDDCQTRRCEDGGRHREHRHRRPFDAAYCGQELRPTSRWSATLRTMSTVLGEIRAERQYGKGYAPETFGQSIHPYG